MSLKKTIFFCLLLFIVQHSSLFGQSSLESIEQAFIDFPDNYSPLLTKAKRSDLLAAYSFFGVDSIKNNFGGVSRVVKLDSENEHLKISLTEKSTMELRIWTRADSTRVLGFSHTVCAPACDSHLGFFDENFLRVDSDEDNPFFPNLLVSDFFDKEKLKSDGIAIEDMVKKHDAFFCSVSLSASGSDGNVLVQSNTKDYLPEDIYTDIKPYLLGDKMTLVWTGQRFEKGAVSW